MLTEILFFLLGCLVGWFTNHWYSVVMRQPNLVHNSGGGGGQLFNSGYRYRGIGVTNELRRLGISFPETVILGKPIRTDFGGRLIEREIAKGCTAQLLEPSGEHICHLYWFENQKVTHMRDIKSGDSASLIVFLRKEDDSGQYMVYQPTSETDPAPKTSGIPKFNETMSFLIQIRYSHHSQTLRIPVTVTKRYNGSFRFKTNSIGSDF